MRRKYRYLKTAALRAPRVRTFSIVTSCFQLFVVCILGFVIGFNIHDVLTRTCWVTPIDPIIPGRGGGRVPIAPQPHVVRVDKNRPSAPKKIPLIFKQLPEKFLKNVSSLNAPLTQYYTTPWKYMKTSGKDFFMLFLVKSAARYVERRFLIRQTWASISKVNGERLGVIFLIGQTKNSEQYELIEKENKLYGDILTSSAPDTYVGLPQKVLAAFKWIKDELHDVSVYYVTTDDDCFIKLPIVFDYYHSNKEAVSSKLSCGYVYGKGHSPIRKSKSKWGVSFDVYPGDVYPEFCHGGMIVWPFYILASIADISIVTNCTGMHLEDVLISGILRQKIYNSTENIISRGYHGLKGKFTQRESFVHHLGMSKNLRRSFSIRWRELRANFRMGENDPMINKRGFSAYNFNATVERVTSLDGRTLNETIHYFISSWQSITKKEKVLTNKLQIGTKPTTETKPFTPE